MNYYDILDLPNDASYDDIKKKYREYAKKYHPDKSTNTVSKNERFKKVTEAYKILSDPYNRGKYDGKLEYEEKEMNKKASSPLGEDFDNAMNSLNKIFMSEEFIKNTMNARTPYNRRGISNPPKYPGAPENPGTCTSFVAKIISKTDDDGITRTKVVESFDGTTSLMDENIDSSDDEKNERIVFTIPAKEKNKKKTIQSKEQDSATFSSVQKMSPRPVKKSRVIKPKEPESISVSVSNVQKMSPKPVRKSRVVKPKEPLNNSRVKKSV